ncbi:MAG: HlyD family secretion protein [Rhodanobacter sp.]
MKPQSLLRLAATLGLLLVAIFLAHALWADYMYSPWTRDGRVRAKVINIAPDVSGLVTEVRVADNEHVHLGDILFVIDPVRFHDALAQAEAEVARAQAQVALAQAQMAQRQSEWSMRREQASRRAHLAGEVITAESRTDYSAQATQAMAAYQAAEAAYKASEAGLQAALAARETAKLNLQRSIVRAPVEGFVANLNLYPGDFATVGLARMALIDAHSFWVYGYFEETKLPRVRVGERADVRLMAGDAVIKGHVESIASGIADRDNPTSANLLADVNPIFTWVRLAQRVPVRIKLDQIPDDIHLAAGMTCTVTLQSNPK